MEEYEICMGSNLTCMNDHLNRMGKYQGCESDPQKNRIRFLTIRKKLIRSDVMIFIILYRGILYLPTPNFVLQMPPKKRPTILFYPLSEIPEKNDIDFILILKNLHTDHSWNNFWDNRNLFIFYGASRDPHKHHVNKLFHVD